MYTITLRFTIIVKKIPALPYSYAIYVYLITLKIVLQKYMVEIYIKKVNQNQFHWEP